MTLHERFDKYATRKDGCWEWSGNKDKDGYGMIGAFPAQGHNLRATHAAWMLYRGVIADGMHLCHHCDNPQCVNPDHLFLGTEGDNKQDAARKGRMARGEKNNQAKVTAEQVIDIRAKAATGIPFTELGREYGMTGEGISLIVRKINWKHI